MSLKIFCPYCQCWHFPHMCDNNNTYSTETLNTYIKQLEKDIKILHRNCDPVDMTYEDHLVWEKWNK